MGGDKGKVNYKGNLTRADIELMLKIVDPDYNLPKARGQKGGSKPINP